MQMQPKIITLQRPKRNLPLHPLKLWFQHEEQPICEFPIVRTVRRVSLRDGDQSTNNVRKPVPWWKERVKYTG